jgi:predicted NUDIX family NTP pyrophosphohydrolase
VATYIHRTVTTTREEWEVPAGPSGGFCAGDMYRAFSAADRAYREEYGIHTDAPLSDDALWVAGQEDGSVVISFQARPNHNHT